MYIANRPVRFDRDYAVGERIPDGVIDPTMTTKLIGMGRIIHVADAEEPQEKAPERAEAPSGAETTAREELSHEDEETAAEGESDGTEAAESPTEHKCEVCGKTFASANALAAHSRVHKK